MFAIRKPDGTYLTDEFGEPFRFATEAEAAKWCGRGETVVPARPKVIEPPPAPRPPPAPFQIIGSDDVPAWQRNREKRRE